MFFMDQARPIFGFEGFPGTDPDHHSTRWGKCYENMSFYYFYFSSGSLGPADIQSRMKYFVRLSALTHK